MKDEEIKALFNFDAYYEDEKYEADMYDEINLLDDKYIPIERVKKLKELLVPLQIRDNHVRDIDCTALRSALLLCSWGYDEGLEYLKTIVEHASGEIGCYPHRLHPYDQSYEWIIKALFNYNLRYSMRGDDHIGLTKTHHAISKLIRMAQRETIGLSMMTYKMKTQNNIPYFISPINETLQYLKKKKKKIALDDYNIEDLTKSIENAKRVQDDNKQ